MKIKYYQVGDDGDSPRFLKKDSAIAWIRSCPKNFHVPMCPQYISGFPRDLGEKLDKALPFRNSKGSYGAYSDWLKHGFIFYINETDSITETLEGENGFTYSKPIYVKYQATETIIKQKEIKEVGKPYQPEIKEMVNHILFDGPLYYGDGSYSAEQSRGQYCYNLPELAKNTYYIEEHEIEFVE